MAEIVELVLTAVATLLTWRIALRIVPPRIAVLTAALAWVAPAVAVRDSVRVYGFRGVTMVCGLLAILLVMRALEGRRDLVTFGCLGLAVGVGWWSSPEIAYYAVPVGVILALAVARSPHWREWVRPGCFTLGTAAAGALPWIWANVGSHLASIRTQPASPADFGSRFGIFFHYALPMETGFATRRRRRMDHAAPHAVVRDSDRGALGEPGGVSPSWRPGVGDRSRSPRLPDSLRRLSRIVGLAGRQVRWVPRTADRTRARYRDLWNGGPSRVTQ